MVRVGRRLRASHPHTVSEHRRRRWTVEISERKLESALRSTPTHACARTQTDSHNTQAVTSATAASSKWRSTPAQPALLSPCLNHRSLLHTHCASSIITNHFPQTQGPVAAAAAVAMIRGVIIVNNHGRPRLVKLYQNVVRMCVCVLIWGVGFASVRACLSPPPPVIMRRARRVDTQSHPTIHAPFSRLGRRRSRA